MRWTKVKVSHDGVDGSDMTLDSQKRLVKALSAQPSYPAFPHTDIPVTSP